MDRYIRAQHEPPLPVTCTTSNERVCCQLAHHSLRFIGVNEERNICTLSSFQLVDSSGRSWPISARTSLTCYIVCDIIESRRSITLIDLAAGIEQDIAYYDLR